MKKFKMLLMSRISPLIDILLVGSLHITKPKQVFKTSVFVHEFCQIFIFSLYF